MSPRPFLLWLTLCAAACGGDEPIGNPPAPARTDSTAPSDATDQTAPTGQADGGSKEVPKPEFVPPAEQTPVTERIGETARLLGKVHDARTAAEAKTRLDELVAEFANLKTGQPDLGAPANLTKHITQLLRNVEVERVLGESLRQLQAVLQP